MAADSTPSRSLAGGPPGPRGVPLLGSLLAFRRDPARFVLGLAETYGDIVHFRLGAADVYFLRHPDYVRDVLVTHQHDFAKGAGLQWARLFLGDGLLTSEGELHTRQRRLSQPAFHRQRIAAYGTVMTDDAVRMREGWRDGQTVDVSHEMMALTLGIVGRTLFDVEIAGEADEIGESLSTIVALFHRFALPFAGTIHRLPLPSNRRFDRARARLDATIYRLIGERRASGKDHGDLLSMLLLAQDEEGDGGSMTDLQLRDELMTLLLAGHETTANALTWTWYLLSRNSGPETRLHAEVDQVLGGAVPTVADLPRLAYTEQVFAESMRLYPPAWGLGRRILRDQDIGGYRLPAGHMVHLSPFASHRDARFFPEPERFDPDRWTPEAKAARPKFAYFPFGGGARQCIGEPFAWMESVLLLATLAQRWRLRLVPGHPVVPQALVTLRPRYGMKMTLEKRGA